MATIGLIVHHERPDVAAAAGALARWLTDGGHDVRAPDADAARAGVDELACPEGSFADGLDVVVSLGGDGTMLRAVDLATADDVPVLGVNFGQLGYLTEVDPGETESAVRRFLAGDFHVEHRMMLHVAVEAGPDSPADAVAESAVAFNEAVLEKSAMGHTVRLDVSIDGEAFTPYTTDGLIVATATGSTAYSFSARGPILAPTLRAMVLTPVSPHMLFDRPLVLEPDSTVRIAVAGHRPAALSVDGRQVGQLVDGDAIVCTAAKVDARLVRFSPGDFLSILKTKFGLNDR